IVTNTVTGAGKSGGGIYAVSSVLTLTNCLIATNSANGIYNSWGLGGGVCLASGVLTIDTCRVTRNAAWGIASGAPYPHGGGIWLGAGTTSTIVRTVVDGNLATARGGGIFSQGKMDLVNSLVVSNTTTASGGAGGLYVTNAGSVMMLMNCTVANNSDPGLRRDDGTVGITNCIFWNNGDDLTGTITVAYSDIQTVDSFWTVGINGCLTNNPLFVDATYYHEQSRIGNYTNGYFSGGGWGKSLSNSPCIDAGAANSPWSLEPAPSGRRANMGAYGNTPVASLSAVMQGSMFMFR
ncbi:MAG: right-handed parallel beta-helix repeat-containing protein, partial [bacterium]